MEKRKIKFLAKANIATADPPAKDLTETEIAEQSYVDEQPDIMRIDAILVSTGMNYNGHTFLKDELIAARNTARHKPMNLEHNEQHIVGHMINSYIVTKDGERLSEDMIQNGGEIPDDFDVVSESVMYAFIFPEQARKIREEARINRLFVSVEAWYDDYDYVVGNRLIERNPNTMAYFEPILKVNGGDGLVEGQRVGMALRNLTYAGIGLVKQPANEDSIIRSVCSVQTHNIATDNELAKIFNSFTKGFIGQQKEVLMVGKKLDVEQEKASEKKEDVAVKKEEETTEVVKEETVVETTGDAEQEADESKETKVDEKESSDVEEYIANFTTKLADMQKKADEQDSKLADIRKQLEERNAKLGEYDKQLNSAMEQIEKLSKPLPKSLVDEVVKQPKAETVVDKMQEETTEKVEHKEQKENTEMGKKEELKPATQVEKPVEKTTIDKEDVADIDDNAIEDSVEDAINDAEKDKDIVEFKSDKDEDSLLNQFVEVIDGLDIGITKQEQEQD